MKRSLDINAKNTDTVEEYIDKAYAPVKVRGIGQNDSFGVKGAYAIFDGILLEWSKSVGNYDIIPEKQFNSVIFNLMTSQSMSYKFGKKEIFLPEQSAIAYRHPEKVSISDTSEHTTVAICNNLMQRRLGVLLDGGDGRRLEFLEQPVPREKIAKFCDFVCELETSSVMKLAAALNSRTASVADVIADALLMLYPNNCSDLLSRPVPSIAPRQVKRAIDYINSHPREHTSTETLAELSGVSVRSLQYSFKAVTSYTVTEYQLLLRLQKAREHIIACPSIPLATIASEWGFASLSNFGRLFKKIYGVTASSTRDKT